MKQIQRKSLVDGVVDQIIHEIRTGSWPVGKRIPTETELTAFLNVSRPSVREAVRALAQVGLLETRQGDGTYVVASDPTVVALRRAVDTADSREVIAVRRALDALAAREAARNRDDSHVAELRSLLDRRQASLALSDTQRFTDHDVEFHLKVAEASGNQLLSGIYRSFDGSLRHSVNDASCQARGADPDQADMHERLWHAIKDQDPDAAEIASLGLLAQQERLLDEMP